MKHEHDVSMSLIAAVTSQTSEYGNRQCCLEKFLAALHEQYAGFAPCMWHVRKEGAECTHGLVVVDMGSVTAQAGLRSN